MQIKTLCAQIDARKDELFELLCALVRIDSQNYASHGNEAEISQTIAQMCSAMGLEAQTYSPLLLPDFAAHPDYMDGRHLEDRLNVTTRLPGRERTNGLLLMGHVDTVPIGDRSQWSFDPLAGEMRGGKIWGRGACDDKYAPAVCLFLLRLLTEQCFRPRKDLIFTGYCDEESGGSHGALAAVLRDPAERIVNMDCKDFQIWHCASGGGCMKYSFHTAEPVDSAKRAADALPIAMELIETFGQRRREELAANRFYRGTIIPSTALRYMFARAGGGGIGLGAGEIGFTFYTDRTKEQIDAELTKLERDLAKRLAPIGIVSDGFRPTTRFFHYTYSEPDCAPIRAMQQAAREASGRELAVCGSCLSDLSVILKYGCREAFGFGIGRDFGIYGGAHQPDEHIACDALVEYAKIIGAYILLTLGD